MFGFTNSYSILYLLFTISLGLCYGFVLLSSAAGDFNEVNVFEKGVSFKYKLQSTVLLNEKGLRGKSVGFFIDGELTVDSVWENGDHKLLRMELKSPKLHIRSRKAPAPDGFIPHSSKLDSIENKPFLIDWNKGKISKIFLSKSEPVSLKNVKKGIASLFQFQLLDGDLTEVDSSGTCTTSYSSSSPSKFSKIKTNCKSDDLPYTQNKHNMLGVEVESSRITEYELGSNAFEIKSITSKDSHIAYLAAREEMGNHIESEQTITLTDTSTSKSFEGINIEEVVEKIGKTSGISFNQETLLTEKEPVTSEEIISFTKTIENLRNQLKNENIGTLKQAKAHIEAVNAGRLAKKEDILKALSSKKNKNILSQLYDILGYVQTQDSHEAVMKNLHFDNENQIDFSERYLWALSFSPQPNPDIIKDILKKYTKTVNIPEKVKETMILTIASMTHKLTKASTNDIRFSLVRDVEETILNDLDYAKDEDKFKYFRALKNLKSQSTIPTLLKYIKSGTQKEGVLAWNAIKSFGSSFWNEEVLKSADKSFFQLDRKYDSSSRTIAGDILLESQPSDEVLTNLLNFLTTNDTAYEVKQYIYQRIKMISESDKSFKSRVEQIIKSNKYLNNYSGLSPRGLSTALSRKFLTHPSVNGSLVTLQEMKSGIAKRGTIDIVLQKGDISDELFSLGIFSGGLSSFISSDNEGEETEEESATAGIELTVLDTQIRPFVFFSGQGELMGHVWSGTASDKTPAFQVLALLHDHLEYIRLGSGYIAAINFKGSTSFDLSGKIEISLWNRNAESLVQKSAGVIILGSSTIDTVFVKSQAEFTASIEYRLDLQTDIDFSSGAQLCMRLTQPDTLFRHNIHKVERIPGSKHKMRISRYQKYVVPGTTYALNKKNTEMCNAIFS
ncbi:unnamed protein product [Diabrotica balteata]|uniref:Vitellogenin domain-containing protein n=1 Tax=Diabrotica balteata TaxID=107213 RepID=A0A9N9T1X8_DIABA|nr:unnamed protein product [Diabrotica balteata]